MPRTPRKKENKIPVIIEDVKEPEPEPEEETETEQAPKDDNKNDDDTREFGYNYSNEEPNNIHSDDLLDLRIDEFIKEKENEIKDLEDQKKELEEFQREKLARKRFKSSIYIYIYKYTYVLPI